ncbi:MAG: hypothetical protein AUK47_26125 [Deltaproteobacteria bacterium CG2_30_63_29]|nr:MAG: hypothetical protein AUK47_26125 [Deltaproteobacteria bacterium CG2_30_63_29]
MRTRRTRRVRAPGEPAASLPAKADPCHHCHEPIPRGLDVVREQGEQTLRFCCTGCRAVYAFIHAEGLESFYAKRSASEAERPRFDEADSAYAFEAYVRGDGEERELDVAIDGIHCASCVWLNEKVLLKTEGVRYARVNYATHVATIRWAADETDVGTIVARIRSTGYSPKPNVVSERSASRQSESRELLIRFGTAAFFASQLMMYTAALYAGYFEGISAATRRVFELLGLGLSAPVVFYSGGPFIRSALRGLRARRFDMDVLIAVGSVSAYVYSVAQLLRGREVYFDTAAMIVALVLLGRYIESVAKNKASRAMDLLAELLPAQATRLSGDRRELVAVSALQPGDRLLVKVGERVPLDGFVVKGETEVDVSHLTGESRPVHRECGAEVIGGSLNMVGVIEVEVSVVLADSKVSRIAKAVEEAQLHKPRLQRAADALVGVFVPAVLTLSVLTAVTLVALGEGPGEALLRAISVLVISCPCALGLATPLAVMVFSTRATAGGVLVRSGETIDALARVNRIVFDKTGTLTEGRPELLEVLADDSPASDAALSMAASLEVDSEHSIGRALVRGARERALPLWPHGGLKVAAGRGVEATVERDDGTFEVRVGSRGFVTEDARATRNDPHGSKPDPHGSKPDPHGSKPDPRESTLDPDWDQRAKVYEAGGDSVVWVAWGGRCRAGFVLRDTVRAEAPTALKALRARAQLEVLSGDDPATTQAVAARLGLSEATGGASPLDKAQRVRALQASGCSVMMVGDGINDAPALSEAAVGVSMGRGTEIAMETADVVIVRDDLSRLEELMRLASETRSVIWQNLFWALFYNVVAIPLAVVGILHPIVAAGAMAASSLLVVLNSLRIGSLAGSAWRV